ncbi:MAG: sulfatase [Opitutaceae bacterium]|jgi:N-sulfoglucosamine sulfohydrolase|nr:sulfatase [Opitutaceae bacterium]
MKNQLPATLIAPLVAAGLSAPGVVTAAGPARPNIVLIVSDDHGLDALGCYGNPVIRTPHLDALAAAGTRFTRAFCTSASCSPSRSVILTGLQGHHNGMYGLQHDEHHFQCFDHVPSLPVMLEAAGYRTARVGKYHVAPDSVFRFQTVLSGGAANDPKTIGRSPAEMAWRSREVIESSDARPFFLYFATDDPHRANAVLPDGTPTFDTWPEPNHFGNRPAGHPGITPVVYNPADVPVPPFLPDTPACRAELAQYYQSVSRLDQGIGVLIKQLKDAGKYDNTFIIYISDNGVAFPGAKTTLYEPGIRLPCIIKSPRQSKGGVTQDALVSWVDLTPTILDVAGALPPGAGFDGRSFKAGLDGTPLRGRDEVYASHTFHQVTMYYPMRAVRTEKYKLIHNLAYPLAFPSARDLIQSPTWIDVIRSGGGLFGKRSIAAFLHRTEFELYDLEADPDEINNLADAPTLSNVRDALIEKTKVFQSETRDPWLHKWQYE